MDRGSPEGKSVKPIPPEVILIFIIEVLMILALWWLKREVEE
jgi:hypothetical protein